MEPEHIRLGFVPEIEKDLILYGLKHNLFYRFFIIGGISALVVFITVFTVGNFSMGSVMFLVYIVALLLFYQNLKAKSRTKGRSKATERETIIKNDTLMELYVTRK